MTKYMMIYLLVKKPNIDGLPDWLKELIYFTAERLNSSDWKKLNFIQNYSHDGVFYSHANPFLESDWSI